MNKVFNKYYGSNLFYTEKWSSIDIGLKKKYLFIFYLNNKNKIYFKGLLFKIIQISYLLNKITFYIFSPFFFIYYYLKRVILFSKFIIKEKLNIIFYPKLIKLH